MKYLDVEEAILKKTGAIHTAREISGQPELWSNIFNKVLSENQKITTFIDEIFKDVKKIILTGAGSSAYLGSSIEGVLQRKSNITTVTVPTTHLVSHPEDYLETSTPTLLISFARSGNSPESVAAVKLAEKYCDVCHHLVITCNSEGSLAKHKFNDKSYVFVLPEEANDKSLAMTGSYSGMLLTAILISDIHNIKSLKGTVETVKSYGLTLLTKYLGQIEKVATLPFKRVVFLGSGPQYGTAMESHLKVQELTDGQVICKNDSYLGFRHGPKAVVDESTLLIYYFSNRMDVLRYERDLVNSMGEGKKPILQIGLSEKEISDISIDEMMVLSNKDSAVSEEYLAVSNIILAQLLGFFKCLKLGLSPDNPSVSGAISRVVHGVIIY
ncbi:SIS domain-containing protein [Arenibacter sp. F26102]|uniref:SIS domain-containing protein n=1 Tax=Arenibacter sp. F26102 TaxID=2926416 RepID=UPI001FF31573|nr:SIS domain-containing protein [Arenibacter sp. F26102]